MAATLCTYGVIRKDYGIIVIFKLCVSQEAAVRPKQSTIVSLGWWSGWCSLFVLLLLNFAAGMQVASLMVSEMF